MNHIRIIVIAFLLPLTVSGQELLESYEKRNSMAKSSLLANYPSRNIGPTVQGGRVVDIEVNLSNPKEYLVAFASGGVFKTSNNGITFEPLFDNNHAIGVGDIAISESNPQIIYVGTGEKNSSRSSYAGSGVYKTEDGGKTWTNFKELSNTQHISRIIIHPENPDIVWVASIGSLYSNNNDRGVLKTSDGGKTWDKTLFVNDSTGIIDLIINPKNPNQLWASSWERTRKAWNFKGSGAGSAIYRSNDGGNTWSKADDGFPEGDQVGRIGLAVSPSDPSIVYAFLDNQAETKETKKEDVNTDLMRLTDFSKMSVEQLLALDNKKLDEFLKDQGFPKKYNAELVKKEVKKGKYKPEAIANYFGDANDALFNTSVVGAEVYRSDNGGTTWKKMNSYDLEGVYFTYGYYFGEIRVAPDNPDLIYIFGVPMLKSLDGGVTYHRLDTIGDVHVDHQALWIDPSDSEHLLLGNDGGLYESYDEGANWRHINNMPVGQFYTVNVDMEQPYNVYGGLQDNGTLMGSSKSVPNRTKHWDQIFGGDGMFVVPDPRNHNLVYTGFQFGNYYRINRTENKFNKITPQHDIGDPALRFNWRTPLKLSAHNPDIVYIGAQKMYMSLDKGETWAAISGDLTKDKPQGNVPYSTISTFSESPLKFGLIYVGTDDGNVIVTKSTGGSWENINEGLPQNKWVSSIFASPHDEGHVFITLNGYRDDDFKAYLFKSEDYGKTWTSIKSNMPDVVVNDLVQDPVNAQLLYAGTDNGTYVSLNNGSSWEVLGSIPGVASYELLVHPRENELVIATHGRSIFIADAKPMQQIAGNLTQPVKVFKIEDIRHRENWGERRYPYLEANEPLSTIRFYLGAPTEHVVFEIYNDQNQLLRKWSTNDIKTGFSSTAWDLKIYNTPPKKGRVRGDESLSYVKKGEYKLKIIAGQQSDEIKFEIK